MIRRVVPFLVVAAIAGASWLAVTLLPGTAFYPVVEYEAGGARFTVMRRGELKEVLCQRAATAVTEAIRQTCPSCIHSSRCSAGLDRPHREALSTAPIALASLRSGDSAVVMTVAASSVSTALEVCQAIEAQSVSQPAAARLRCFPAGAKRQ